MEPTKTTHEITGSYGNSRLAFQRVDFVDKIVLNVLIDDVIDTTFDIPLSTQSTINLAIQDEHLLGVEPVVLVGDPQNLKLQVIAGQIGKVVQNLKNPRNVILSIGSRWFGNKDDTNDGDFDKLMFVLQNVQKLVDL